MSKRTSSLLIDEQPLQVIPSLACKMGLNRAMFLQQLHYWLQKPGSHERDGKRWIYNTFAEWHEQFPFWTAEGIRKIVSQLEDKGVIKTTDRYNERKGDRTKWYTIDYETLNALFDPDKESNESAPDNPPQPLDHPDKSTERPDKSTELEPDKSTQRYQRVPESSNRDSDLQSGESAASDAAPEQSTGGNKAEESGAFGVRELVERVSAARERGAQIHDPVNVGNYGQFFKNRSKRHDVDTLLTALDYLVAKAAGEIESEKKAWCGFDTALDAVLAGWRPKAKLTLVDNETLERENAELEEWGRDLAKLLQETESANG
jgi:hypothetical protein